MIVNPTQDWTLQHSIVGEINLILSARWCRWQQYLTRLAITRAELRVLCAAREC